jgi:hypothetical protein
VELKFGCEFLAHGDGAFIVKKKLSQIFFLWEGAHAIDGFFYPKQFNEVAQVLDRPIRLADVLLAIGSKYAVDGAGEIYRSGYLTGDSVWNLRADDLEQQSEETISFLYELLS